MAGPIAYREATRRGGSAASTKRRAPASDHLLPSGWLCSRRWCRGKKRSSGTRRWCPSRAVQGCHRARPAKRECGLCYALRPEPAWPVCIAVSHVRCRVPAAVAHTCCQLPESFLRAAVLVSVSRDQLHTDKGGGTRPPRNVTSRPDCRLTRRRRERRWRCDVRAPRPGRRGTPLKGANSNGPLFRSSDRPRFH